MVEKKNNALTFEIKHIKVILWENKKVNSSS